MTYSPLNWNVDDFVDCCWGIDFDGVSSVVFSASSETEKLHLLQLLAQSLDRLPPGVEVEVAGG